MHGTTLRPFFAQAAPTALGQLKEVRETLARAAGEASGAGPPVDPSELSGGRTGRSTSIGKGGKEKATPASSKRAADAKAEAVNSQLLEMNIEDQLGSPSPSSKLALNLPKADQASPQGDVEESRMFGLEYLPGSVKSRWALNYRM